MSVDKVGEGAPLRTLIVHAAEFIGDFVRYSGRKGITTGLLVALGASLEGVGLLLLVPILAIVLDTSEKTGRLAWAASYVLRIAGTHSRFEKLALLLSLFTALLIFRALMAAKRDVALAELQAGFVEYIRSNVAKALAAARWDHVARLRHARITHVMSSGIQNVGGAANFFLQCIVSLTLIVSQWILALILSPLLALLAFILLACGGVALGLILRRARMHGLSLTESNLTLLHSTTQFLGGMKLAMSQNLQRGFVAEFVRTLAGQTNRQVSYARLRSNATVVTASITALAASLIVLVGLSVMDVEPSLLFAMLYLFARMTGPMLQLQQGAQLFAVGLPEYEKIKELQTELAAARSPMAMRENRGEISDARIDLNNVTFMYPNDRHADRAAPILRNVNLSIAAGSMVGVFGPSGEGKTTFVDLLVGLLPPWSGEIRIGNMPLCDAMLPTWRDHVSYVAQDPFLLHDTVRRNLTWAAPKATDDELWSVLHIVGADGLVRRMTNTLDTVVGERGMLVSGGERQRLALARAILRLPRLLILDEATNALDQESERMIIRRLRDLVPRPTVIMIAHRIESVRLCERILRLEAGQFVEIEMGNSRSAYVQSSVVSSDRN